MRAWPCVMEWLFLLILQFLPCYKLEGCIGAYRRIPLNHPRRGISKNGHIKAFVDLFGPMTNLFRY